MKKYSRVARVCVVLTGIFLTAVAVSVRLSVLYPFWVDDLFLFLVIVTEFSVGYRLLVGPCSR